MTPEEWLEWRTFTGARFDPERLAADRRRGGLSISICLPTLNVADTVGPIVAAIRERWIEDVPLIDELAIVDSASVDDTVARAREAGAEVIHDAEVLPEMGPGKGKGEAMWKSLAVLGGDVVAWIDSDIVDFDPSFVPGMVGPLIEHPEISYVKALYRRPLGADGEGGGRVTEICARPLINQFYPDLAGFAQPLSGEAAGRREALWRVPFFGGYAVELGLLIDLLGVVGLPGLAQVDLGARRHVNQPTRALGPMAAAITQAVLRRVAESGRAPRALAQPMPFARPTRRNGALSLERLDAAPAERPPMDTVRATPR